MSSSTNPIYPQTPVFIPDFWEDSTDTALTTATADKRYLKYPIGQSGTQTLSGLIVNNISSIFNTSRLYINSLDFGGGYIQTNTILNDSTSTTGTGWFNSFFGNDCGKNITSGGTNTGTGEYETLLSLTSGSSNCAYGNGSLKNVTTTSFNSAFGYGSGFHIDGSYNTCIGTQSDCDSGVSNSTAIGAQTVATQSNQIILGTVNEKVIIPNQIQFNYVTNRTFTTTSLGYTQQYQWTSVLTVVGSPGLTIASFSDLPIGIYIFSSNFLNFGVTGATRNDYILTTQTNITNLSCGTSLEYAGNSVTKIDVTLCFILQVTDPSNTLLYNYTNVTGPAGTIQPSSATVLRIA